MEGSPINNSVYIVSADAKDLFLSNYSNDCCTEYTVRYSSGDNRGEFNTKRFVNTLDYSLDLSTVSRSLTVFSIKPISNTVISRLM